MVARPQTLRLFGTAWGDEGRWGWGLAHRIIFDLAPGNANDGCGRCEAWIPTPTGVGAIPRQYNFAADILARNLKAGRADRPAFIDPRGTWTYGQLDDRVARFAAILRTLGVRREERVLIALLDTIDWPTAFLGCLKAGVVAVPVNTLMTEDDYRFLLADSRARVLVVSDALYPRFEKLIGASSDLEHVIVSGEPVKGRKRFEDLIDGAMAEAADRADRPRRHRVLALHLRFDRQAQGRGACPRRSEIDRRSVRRALSQHHRERRLLFRGEAVLCLWARQCADVPMSAGACTVLLPDRPTPDGVAALLRNHSISVFYAVPTFYAAFLARCSLSVTIRAIGENSDVPTSNRRSWNGARRGCSSGTSRCRASLSKSAGARGARTVELQYSAVAGGVRLGSGPRQVGGGIVGGGASCGAPVPQLPPAFAHLRGELGAAVYGSMGVARHDAEARRVAVLRNWEFFRAPLAGIICMHRDLDYVDSLGVGMFLQTLVLALTARGLGSCVQVSIAGYPETIREQLGIGEEMRILCGLAVGYPDPDFGGNALRVGRNAIAQNVQFVDSLSAFVCGSASWPTRPYGAMRIWPGDHNPERVAVPRSISAGWASTMVSNRRSDPQSRPQSRDR